ncbi:hypothetical protein F4678DRAFT_467739 [Xylaria arbuscula]|nr:hypothetical protein F4678DRAFT_467739 [Xylaria arbuscula]
MYGINEKHLLQSFATAIDSRAQTHASDHIVVELDAYKLQAAAAAAGANAIEESFWAQDVRLSRVVHDMTLAGGRLEGAAVSQSTLAAINAAETPTAATSLVTEHFISKLARMLLLSAEDFGPDAKSIADYGIDSIVGFGY